MEIKYTKEMMPRSNLSFKTYSLECNLWGVDFSVFVEAKDNIR